MQAFDTVSAPLARDDHGVIRVGGTRVSLESVVTAFDRGASAEEIAESFPNLELAAIYAALAYVLSHRDSVDAYMGERQQRMTELRTEAESRFPPEGLRARMLARRDKGTP